jgi:hypothetical protein
MQCTCYSCQVLIKFGFCQQIAEKRINIKFYKNPSFLMRTDRRTDMTKLTFTFRSFEKAPKNKMVKRNKIMKASVNKGKILINTVIAGPFAA